MRRGWLRRVGTLERAASSKMECWFEASHIIIRASRVVTGTIACSSRATKTDTGTETSLYRFKARRDPGTQGYGTLPSLHYKREQRAEINCPKKD